MNRIFGIIKLDLTREKMLLEEQLESTFNGTADANVKIMQINQTLERIALNEIKIQQWDALIIKNGEQNTPLPPPTN